MMERMRIDASGNVGIDTYNLNDDQLDLISKLFTGGFKKGGERSVKLWIKAHDVVKALGGDTYAANEEKIEVHDDKIYRVTITKDRVNIVCLGMDMLDPQAEGDYDSVDDLPKWVQDRLAVLMITPATPPTREVESVGRRIGENIYWVYAQ